MMERVTVGPFTWEGPTYHSDNEVWTLVGPIATAIGTRWALKDYGPPTHPGSGFSNWRLVSGGPFRAAGEWFSRDEAMTGVVPYLSQQVRQTLVVRHVEVERLQKALHDADTALGQTD
jgi:hypothetical protein